MICGLFTEYYYKKVSENMYNTPVIKGLDTEIDKCRLYKTDGDNNKKNASSKNLLKSSQRGYVQAGKK